MASPLNGGAAFAGKSGRSTASACDANTMETITIAAAHFMSRGLIKIEKRGKKNLGVIAVIRRKRVICDLFKRLLLHRMDNLAVRQLTI